MTIQHTSGPWRVDDSSGDLVVLAKDGKVIAYFGDMETVEGTDLRDAALVAAAPELLATLKEAVAHIRSMTHDWEDEEDDAPALVAAEALIAKAEGHEP